MSFRSFLSVMVAGLLIATVRPVAAATVVLIGPADTELTNRARAELEIMGFDIKLAKGDPASQREAVAVVRVLDDRIEVWTVNADRSSAKLTHVIARGADSGTDTVTAVERVRAALQALAPSAPPPPPADPTGAPRTTAPPAASNGTSAKPSAPPSRQVSDPQRTPERPLAVAPARPVPEPESEHSNWAWFAGPSATVQTGGVAAHLSAEALWFGLGDFGLGAGLSLPVVPSTIDDREGRAELSSGWAGPRLGWHAITTSRLDLAVSFGWSVAWLKTFGEAAAPFSGKSDTAIVSMAGLGLRLALHVADGWSAVLAPSFGYALPKVAVEFAGRRIETWGGGVAQMTLGVGQFR